MNKDYIINEVDKITTSLARLVGFKKEAQPLEFVKLAETMAQDDFNVKLPELLKQSAPEFEQFLEHQDYHPHKLEALAELLYLYSDPFTDTPETALTLQKVLLIFSRLEQKHHRTSFEMIGKQNSIHHFLQKRLS